MAVSHSGRSRRDRRGGNQESKAKLQGGSGKSPNAMTSPKQRDEDHVEPAEQAVDDRPQDRMVVGVGDRDGERRAEADAVFRALDADAVIAIAVHGDPYLTRCGARPARRATADKA